MLRSVELCHYRQNSIRDHVKGLLGFRAACLSEAWTLAKSRHTVNRSAFVRARIYANVCGDLQEGLLWQL